METSPGPTTWTTGDVADDFVCWDDTIGWTFGYPFVFDALRLGQPEVTTVLDLGCGPGHVAQRAAEDHDIDVYAADISPAMLDIAISRYGHARVSHHLLTDGTLEFLPDDSVAAAMSNFVFVCVSELRQLRELVTETHRVLRPGGRFAILNAHPEHIGVGFDSFRIGQPGARYSPGDPMPVRLRQTDGEWMDIVDTYWSGDTYREVLRGAGFTRMWHVEPTVADARRLLGAEAIDARRWTVERHTPPFLLVVGEK